MSDEHVVPTGDLVVHRVEADAECVCGPRTEPVVDDGRVVGFVIVHHSLDGRELVE